MRLRRVGRSERGRNRVNRRGAGGAAVVPMSTAIMATAPKGYWKFNDAAGPAQDSSGNARHTTSHTNIFWRNLVGPDGASYATFQGSVVCRMPYNADFNLTAAGLTVFALIRPTTLANRGIAGMSNGSYEWSIELQSDGSMRAYSMPASGAYAVRQSLSPAASFPVNTWHGFLSTMSDASATAVVENYKNSATPLGATRTSGGAGPAGPALNDGSIGCIVGTGTSGFIGEIAHVAMWKRVLTSLEIASIMAAADAEGWF